MPSDLASTAATHALTTDFYSLLALGAPYLPTVDNPTPPPIPSSLLRKSYRRTSLLYHPDKNPSPDAAATFHLLTTAFDLLSDPEAKKAYDAALVGRLRRKRRGEEMDVGRRKMREELEEREREAGKRARMERMEEDELRRQLERLKAEGAELRRKREEALRKAEEEEELREREREDTTPAAEVPPSATKKETQPQTLFSDLDRTILVRYKPPKKPSTPSGQSPLTSFFATFGRITDTITKPPTNPPKKFTTTLFVYESILGAYSAVNAFRDGSLKAAKDTVGEIKEVKWAGGKEPDVQGIIDGLRGQTSTSGKEDGGDAPTSKSTSTGDLKFPFLPTAAAATPSPSSNPPKFSFSTKKPTTPATPTTSTTSTPTPTGLKLPDYESVTLLRMREMEKKRLEKEIRMREEAEDAAAATGPDGGE